jgi:cobalt-zinc-cadmium efflux system membrane fusion protein
VDVATIAYPDKHIRGTVDKMSQVLDPTNKTLRIRIRLENPDLMLRPEMFARVIVSNKENRKAVSIPTSALINQNGKSFVVVYKSPADMHIAEVAILSTKSDRTYLLGGLQPGDKIIIRNQLLIFQQLLNQ